MKTSDKEYQKIKSRIDAIKIGSMRFMEDAGWCTDRISWAYKFKKITEQQMEELCERMVELFEMDRSLTLLKRKIR